MASAADRDPRHHTQKMQKALEKLKDHLRDDITKVDELQLRAMFETSAEVLGASPRPFGITNRRMRPRGVKPWLIAAFAVAGGAGNPVATFELSLVAPTA